MSRHKDWDELSPRSRARYERVLERVYGRKAPTFVPDYSKLPESMRLTLRAALQAYWAAKGDEGKGVNLARQIKKTRAVRRMSTWPTREEADRWLTFAERAEPRAAFLIAKVCFKRGLRSEEVLGTPREAWESAVRYGRLKFVGKGNKERVLDVASIRTTIREMLDTPGALPHDKSAATRIGTAPRWSVPGELLAKPGSTLGTQRNLFARYLKKVAAAAGLDPAQWKPHALRHVFADRYRGSPYELQQALGHASIETTMVYKHPTAEDVGRHFEGE